MKTIENVLLEDVKEVVSTELSIPTTAISVREDGNKIISLVTARQIAEYNCFEEILTICGEQAAPGALYPAEREE